MPGDTWPCTKIRSPPWPSDGACQKWLKPVSYRVAEDWNEAMCPPSSEDSLLARSTIATAFHRMIERILCSMAPSPGCSGCSWGAMVFRYGVFAEYGTGTPLRRPSPISSSSRNPARSAPSNSMTESNASRHSLVSTGSASLAIWLRLLRLGGQGGRYLGPTPAGVDPDAPGDDGQAPPGRYPVRCARRGGRE